jgi:hypothetical protein
VGTYEDLVRDTVDAALAPGHPLALAQIARAVTPRLSRFGGGREHELVVEVVELVLRADPKRFVEVAPGLWARRGDGPEAGVPSRPRRPPFAGSAAAAADPPERPVSVDAVGGTSGKVSPAQL